MAKIYFKDIFMYLECTIVSLSPESLLIPFHMVVLVQSTISYHRAWEPTFILYSAAVMKHHRTEWLRLSKDVAVVQFCDVKRLTILWESSNPFHVIKEKPAWSSLASNVRQEGYLDFHNYPKAVCTLDNVVWLLPRESWEMCDMGSIQRVRLMGISFQFVSCHP